MTLDPAGGSAVSAEWRVQIHTDLEAVHTLWDELYAAMPDAGPFALWDYAAIWWRHYGKAFRLYVIVVLHNGQPCALLPLMYHGHVLRWLAAPKSDYVTPLFSAAADRSHVFAVFAEHLRGIPWAVLDLHYLYPDLAQHFIDAMRGVWYRVDDRMACPYIAVNGRSWQDYWTAKPAKTHKEMRELNNRLARNHLIAQVTTIAEPDRIAALFPALEMLHERRQQTRSGHGAFAGDSGAFFLEVCRAYAAKGYLTLSVAHYNDALAAYVVTFTLNRAARFWKTSYDPLYRLYSPGKFLFFQLLQHHFERNVYLIDFLAGQEPYKFQWTEQLQLLTRPIFYRSPLRGQFAAWRLQVRMRFARIDRLRRLWVWVSHRLP